MNNKRHDSALQHGPIMKLQGAGTTLLVCNSMEKKLIGKFPDSIQSIQWKPLHAQAYRQQTVVGIFIRQRSF